MSEDGRRELYVYYRVAQAHWRDAVHAAAAAQQRLRSAHPGLVARVLRRPDARDDGVTVMEVYAIDGGSIDAALEADIARETAPLQRWLIGERHVEHFDALD